MLLKERKKVKNKYLRETHLIEGIYFDDSLGANPIKEI